MKHKTSHQIPLALLGFAFAAAALVVMLGLITPARAALALDGPARSSSQAMLPSGASGESLSSVSSTAVSPTSQIRSPFRDAVITKTGSLIISGFAWDTGMEAPAPGDSVLTVDRLSDRVYYVQWTAATSATNYLLEEADNEAFSNATSSVLASSETGQWFTKQVTEDGTYFYRVKAVNASMPVLDARWSNVVSVVVPWPAGALSSGLDVLAPIDIAATNALTVQVRIDGTTQGTWSNAPTTVAAWGGWNWTYTWSPLPEEHSTQYAIHTRAISSTGGIGPIDTITVTLQNKDYPYYFPLAFRRWPPLPNAPSLNAISQVGTTGDFTLSWAYTNQGDQTDPTGFTLQESTNPDFTSPTNYANAVSPRAFTGKPVGFYYYRVQGVNGFGGGTWSSVRSVEVLPQGYRDDFNAPAGWAYRRGDDMIIHLDNFWIRYKDGMFYNLFIGRYDFAVASPLHEAPAVPYTIQGRVKGVGSETFDGRHFMIRNGSTFGIIFGGNAGSPCPADRTAPLNQGCFSHYYRVMVVYDQQHLDAFQWQLKRIDYHDPNDDGKAKGVTLVSGNVTGLDATGWNEWKAEVTASTIKVYVNGRYLGQSSDTRFVNDPYFGTYFGSPEVGDGGIQWDWFEVKAQ